MALPFILPYRLATLGWKENGILPLYLQELDGMRGKGIQGEELQVVPKGGYPLRMALKVDLSTALSWLGSKQGGISRQIQGRGTYWTSPDTRLSEGSRQPVKMMNTYTNIIFNGHFFVSLLLFLYFPFYCIPVSQQSKAPSKKPKLGPKVGPQNWWIERIKGAPEVRNIKHGDALLMTR